MTEYISKEVARRIIDSERSKEQMIRMLEQTPTADVRENKRGEWLYEQLIPNDITGHMYGECSICHKVRIIDNFCPNCGTEMMKREKDK